MKISLEPNNQQKPGIGKVLISEPFLNDPYFKRVVIILCEFNNEEGAIGFTLNNYVKNLNISNIVSDFPEFKTNLCIGGPVKKSNLFYLHTLGNTIPNSKEILPGLYFGGDYSEILKRIKTGEIKEKEIRFFIGYSGWSVGQLESEIEEKSWFVAKTDAQTIMDTTEENLWKKVLSEIGPKERIISNIPKNHKLN